MTSRLKDLATELETSADKDVEPVSNHLTDFCSQFTANQKTASQDLKFLQALKQLSSEFDRIKENQKSRQMGDRLGQIAKEIAQMLEDFWACCLMDKQFVSTVKPVYNDHPWDPKIVALLTGSCCVEVVYIIKIEIGLLKWWPLYYKVCRQVAVFQRWPLAQV
jgi:hypothetical protein